jgi:uncharacterized membrane protein HdeD (DUF308 family)
MLIEPLAKNWWMMLLRGICAILFGLLAFSWPGLTLWVLIVLYGAYVLTDGLLALMAACSGDKVASRWWLALIGILGLAAGCLIFFYPAVTAILLLVFIATWSIVHGLFEIAGAIQLRKEIDHEWLLILGGILSVLFGVLVLVNPGAGALTIVWAIGAYAIAFGILLVGFSMRLRKHRDTMTPAAT